MKVINLSEVRQSRKREEEKVEALKRVQKYKKCNDSQKFNYEFYCLVDCFMHETHPDYGWKFDVWLEKLEKQIN